MYIIYIYYIIYLCISPRESHIKISTVYSVQCLHSSRFRARWRDVFPSLWEICLDRKGYHTSAKNAWRVCPPHSFQAPKCEDYTTGYVWQLFLCGWCCCWQLNNATCPPWRNIWTEKNPGNICKPEAADTTLDLVSYELALVGSLNFFDKISWIFANRACQLPV